MAILFNSCATIFSGTSQNISVSSQPTQADVVIKTFGGIEMFNGKTPATAKLGRDKEYQVTIKLPGYKEQTIVISKSLNSWALCNLTNLLFWGIDYVSGAMFKLDPSEIMITLQMASNEKSENKLFAMFITKDNDGELRMLSIPLVLENVTSSQK